MIHHTLHNMLKYVFVHDKIPHIYSQMIPFINKGLAQTFR